MHPPKRHAQVISIHALRGEGDGHTVRASSISTTISIHALRGEGDKGRFITSSILYFLFQSTPSVGRATDCYLWLISSIKISIHALRGEGDCYSVCSL